MQEIFVTKADGSEEPFSEDKVRRAMERAGVPKYIQNDALSAIRPRLYPGIPTSVLYEDLMSFLKTKSKPHAARFSLKRSIMEFGPSGFPFEDLVARIFQTLGYTTIVGEVIEGVCVSHEIDVIASKKDEKLMVEVKFHNQPGVQSDVKVALYVYSRFLDVKDPHHFTQGVIVTNTRLTYEALKFAQCRGMRVISWDYPQGGSLRDLIEVNKLHPLTECVNLNHREKEALLGSGVVLCTDLVKIDPEVIAHQSGLPLKKVQKAQEEGKQILAQLNEGSPLK